MHVVCEHKMKKWHGSTEIKCNPHTFFSSIFALLIARFCSRSVVLADADVAIPDSRPGTIDRTQQVELLKGRPDQQRHM